MNKRAEAPNILRECFTEVPEYIAGVIHGSLFRSRNRGSMAGMEFDGHFARLNHFTRICSCYRQTQAVGVNRCRNFNGELVHTDSSTRGESV